MCRWIFLSCLVQSRKESSCKAILHQTARLYLYSSTSPYPLPRQTLFVFLGHGVLFSFFSHFGVDGTRRCASWHWWGHSPPRRSASRALVSSQEVHRAPSFGAFLACSSDSMVPPSSTMGTQPSSELSRGVKPCGRCRALMLCDRGLWARDRGPYVWRPSSARRRGGDGEIGNLTLTLQRSFFLLPIMQVSTREPLIV